MTTTKMDDPMTQTTQLSPPQLDALFKRLNLAHMRRIYQEVAHRAEKESWSIATSSLFCSPKKLHDASKPDCSAAPAARTSPSSRPSMSSISLCNRLSGNRCSVPTSDRTSSPRDDL